MWISLCLCVLLLHYVAANSNIISKIHRNSFRYTHHRSFSWPSLLGKCKKQSSIAPAIRAKDPAIIHATSELALIGPDTSFTALRSSSSSRLSGVRRWLSQCIAPLKYLRSTSSILREWERDMDAMEIVSRDDYYITYRLRFSHLCTVMHIYIILLLCSRCPSLRSWRNAQNVSYLYPSIYSK